jgi:hypothetical protein
LGPACERVHDIFDEVFVEQPSHLPHGRELVEWSQDTPFLITTWHERLDREADDDAET